MRISYVAAVSIMLISIPVLVKAANTAPVKFGNYTCSQQVPCSDDGTLDSGQWAKLGNACMAQGFGYTSPNGFIDESAGLDESNCMLSKIEDTNGKTKLTPKCCVVQIGQNRCAVHCDLFE
jgi:hypothetical protein